MKVFLFQAYLGRREPPIFPLGLAYIASSIANHEVRVFDPNVADDPYGDLINNINEFNPEVIGVSLRNTDTTQYGDPFNYFKALKVTINLIKSINQRATLVIGGAAFSIFADKIMERIPHIDFGVYLDGEESFPELLDNLESPAAIKGIYYRDNGAVKFTGPREITDFIWSLKPKWDLFEFHRYDGPESLGVLSRKGCSLKCIYCVYPFLSGSVQRLRLPASVVDEIEELVTKWGVKQFTFADSVFAIPKRHAVAICQEIIKRNIKVKWGAFFNEKSADQEFLQLAQKAGCVSFNFSPDGFNDRSLQLLGKPFTLADVTRTYQAAQAFKDAQATFCFFANPPGQTFAAFLKLMWLYLKTKLSLDPAKKVQVFVNIPRLLPNTELYKMALAEGSIDSKVDLLPDADQVPLSLFYQNPQIKLVDYVFTLFHHLKVIIKKFRPTVNFR